MFASEADVRAPLLELRGVTRSFGELTIVQATDLTVRSGDFIAITGASGSGKSTLLNLLGLLDTPSTGAVLVQGERVDHLRDDQRAALRGRTIGFIFQSFHLLDSRSALANVELGMLYRALAPAERRHRAERALKHVALDHRRDARPTTLSGGERQRVAIARALAADVDVLLADEPTGNLDSRTGDLIMDLFDELHGSGLTVVLVTHSEQVASRAQRRFTMTDGRLTAGGSR